jgi:AGZA family xanthine/uracil permease-like MFS transporter
VFLELDVLGALKVSLLPAIVGIFFTDLFDSISTFMGVSLAAGLLDDDGNPKRLKEGLIVDSFATLGAGLFGTSSGTAYIESAAGVNAGARTGLAAVVTALCFLPCFFVAPLAGAVPAYATAPVLILVGAMMFRTVGAIDFTRIEESLPAFLTVVLIPLTFSITQGILWGFVAHVSLYMMMGRRREVPGTMYVLAIVAVGLLLLEHGKWQ